jgi:hypothetical protein
MRDPKEWAGSLSDEMLCDEGGGLYFDKVEALIREAQEDGARHAACQHCGPGTDLNTALNQLADERVAVGWAKESVARLEAQVAELEDARVSRFDGLMVQLDEARATIKEMHTRIVDVEARGSAQVAALTERAERAEGRKREFTVVEFTVKDGDKFLITVGPTASGVVTAQVQGGRLFFLDENDVEQVLVERAGDI